MKSKSTEKYVSQGSLVRTLAKILSLLILIVPISQAQVTPSVGPGGLLYIDEAKSGGTECFDHKIPHPCLGDPWNPPGQPTIASVKQDLIRGAFAPVLPVQVSLDQRAIAYLDYEFTVADSDAFPGGVVNTDISVKYDLVSFISGAAAYSASTLMSMTLTDISDPNEAYIASASLWDGGRQGDQGFTDVAIGGESHVFDDEVVSMSVTLRRGSTYRVRVSAQGSGSVLILGKFVSIMTGHIEYLRVQVDEDELEEIFRHDARIAGALDSHNMFISNRITNHDSDIKQQLSTHDADIKALLGNIKATVEENQRLIKIFRSRQLEVMRLLITPDGQREIDPRVVSCSGDNCPEYPAYQFCKNGSHKWNCRQ